MENNKILETKIKIIINNDLYKRKIIDEETYSKANEKLLLLLKKWQ